MKNNWKKGIAVLMAASMLFANMGSLSLAEDTTEAAAAAETSVTEMPVTEAPATEAPVTEAPATEAPVTEAPATEAPVTEAPATEAPVTEAPATEAPVTEAPATEAPVTEAPATEAPETETKPDAAEEKSEKETETEDTVFRVTENEYTVCVELPEGLKLPKGTALKAKVRKETDETYADSLFLAEKECGIDFGESLIYDLHFEKDGKEVELEERGKEDIKVTFTLENAEFKGLDFSDAKLKVYHIKDMTAAELEAARAAFDGENDSETGKLLEQKAVELDVKHETVQNKVSVTFKTDGFSDYVFGIPKDKEETEPETAKEAESEPETESETETETVTETKSEAEEAQTEALTEAVSEAAEVEAVSAAEPLVINFNVVGKATAASHPIIITGDPGKAAEQMPVVTVNGQAVTGEAVYDYKANVLKINIPATITSAAIVVDGLPDGTYTIDAGGNYIDNAGTLIGDADYSSYSDTGNTHGEMPVQFTLPLIGTATEISVTDRYTAVNVSLNDKTSKTGVTGGVFRLQKQKNDEWSDVTNASVSTTNGAAAITGLPFGRYRVICDSVPGVYAFKSITSPIEVELTENALTAASAFETVQIAVRVRAVDPQGNRLSGAEFDLNGYKLTYTDNTLRGVLERGTAYSLKQTVTPYGYVTAKNVKVTPSDTTKIQVVQLVNKPTVVQISALSKADGSRIAGVTFEVRDSNGNAVKDCTWTSTSGVQELKAKLQPGVKYTLVQTSVPDGYYIAAAKTFTVSKDGSIDTVTVTNDVTKVSISRKGYDSRTKKADGKYEYTNMKMLSGAVLEVQDLNGNTIERWTSDEEPHVITGKLAAGAKYRLVEITTPSGYEKGGQGEFEVKSKEKVDSTKNTVTGVTMQTRRANGKIQVVKRAALNGKAIKLDQTFYCALFLDEAKTKMYSEGGVKALNMTADTVYASATFSNIPAGIYYIAETDRNGKVLNGSESAPAYKITITNEKLNLSAGMSLLAEIVNDYQSKPTSGYTNVSANELKQSYKDEYANYGGSAQAAAAMAAGDGTVATGDNTNIMIYVILLAVAVVIIGAGIVIKKKKK